MVCRLPAFVNRQILEEEVMAIALQVAEAMAELHQGEQPKVYGDIKPENIMMQPDGKIKVVGEERRMCLRDMSWEIQ